MYISVAQRIIELREQKGVTTNKLANMAGVSQSHLREIELGKKNPTVETLSIICEQLGISLAAFFCTERTEISPLLISIIGEMSDKQQLQLAEFLQSLKPTNGGKHSEFRKPKT